MSSGAASCRSHRCFKEQSSSDWDTGLVHTYGDTMSRVIASEDSATIEVLEELIEMGEIAAEEEVQDVSYRQGPSSCIYSM